MVSIRQTEASVMLCTAKNAVLQVKPWHIKIGLIMAHLSLGHCYLEFIETAREN